MAPTIRLFSSRRGFSLAETLIGATIAGSVLLLSSQIFLGSRGANAEAERRDEATSAFNLTFRALANPTSCRELIRGNDGQPAIVANAGETLVSAFRLLNSPETPLLSTGKVFDRHLRISRMAMRTLRYRSRDEVVGGVTLHESLVQLQITFARDDGPAPVPHMSVHRVYAGNDDRIVTCNNSFAETDVLDPVFVCASLGGQIKPTLDGCFVPGFDFGGIFVLDENGACIKPNAVLPAQDDSRPDPACACPNGFTTTAWDPVNVDHSCPANPPATPEGNCNSLANDNLRALCRGDWSWYRACPSKLADPNALGLPPGENRPILRKVVNYCYKPKDVDLNVPDGDER